MVVVELTVTGVVAVVLPSMPETVTEIEWFPVVRSMCADRPERSFRRIDGERRDAPVPSSQVMVTVCAMFDCRSVKLPLRFTWSPT